MYIVHTCICMLCVCVCVSVCEYECVCECECVCVVVQCGCLVLRLSSECTVYTVYNHFHFTVILILLGKLSFFMPMSQTVKQHSVNEGETSNCGFACHNTRRSSSAMIDGFSHAEESLGTRLLVCNYSFLKAG